MEISLSNLSNINWPKPWPLFLSELIGTAFLVFVGLSVVIMMSGAGSPLAGITPSGAWGRLITGFLFGTTGAIIAISPVGKISGAHIDPVVSLGFAFASLMILLRDSNNRPMAAADLRGHVASDESRGLPADR
jgi:glycerol uptake facilitator-like aquaporin